MHNSTNNTESGRNQPKTSSFFDYYGGQVIWFPVLALTAFGLLFVYSSSSVYAGQKYGDEYLFFKKQLFFLFPALIMGIMGAKIKINTLERYSGHLFIGAIICTLLTKAPIIGKTVGGAARWVSIFGFQIQPGEFLKIATLLFTANLLIKHPKNYLLLWPVAFAFGALLLQPDFGSTMILICGITAIIFIHGLPWQFFLTGILTFVPILIGIMISAPYRMRRLITFLDPFADPLGAGFQVIQSFVAIANGSSFGKGLGSSQQKLFFLPEAHTDFILAVIAEEMGFIGILVITSIYLLFFFGILQLLKKVKNKRDRLIGTGILAIFASSTLVNMGVVAGLLPTKGLPLPFVSAGGSSLLANFFMVGLLSQIHKNTMLEENIDPTGITEQMTKKLGYLPNLKVNSDV